MIEWKIIKNDKNKNPYDNIRTFIKKETYSHKKALIVVKNLSHSFKSKIVYKNINFEIYENEKVAFLGPNGAGKTTIISTICGFIKSKEGNIDYLFDYDKKPYEKLSIQFQDLQFPFSLTPKDLIEFTIKLTNSKNYEEEIIEGIKVFGIDNILNIRMSKLSGGQQQRINVFLSIIGKPKILFLDEFTTGLDISIKNKLQKYIVNFCEKNKITLVMISHDIDSIEEMADRIIVLADKKIIADAHKKDIEDEFGSTRNMLKKFILS